MRLHLISRSLPVLALWLVTLPARADGVFTTTSSATGTAGQVEYNALKGLLTGNVGFGIAMLWAAYGCYLWLVQQKAGPGLLLLITGATIALLPQLMDAMHANLCPIVTAFGGTCANTNFTAGTVSQ